MLWLHCHFSSTNKNKDCYMNETSEWLRQPDGWQKKEMKWGRDWSKMQVGQSQSKAYIYIYIYIYILHRMIIKWDLYNVDCRVKPDDWVRCPVSMQTNCYAQKKKKINQIYLPIDWTVRVNTTPFQSGSGSNCNQGLLHNPQSYSNEASLLV